MITLLRSAIVLLLLTASAAAQPARDKLLTTADVEKLTGATAVKLVPRGSQTGAGGDLNFATADGKLLLMINLGDAQLYRKAREQKQITVGGQTYPMELFAHAVPGLGDEAFASPPGKMQYVIYARKGNNGLTVSTYYSGIGEAGKPRLTEAQLKQIAQLIFSRW